MMAVVLVSWYTVLVVNTAIYKYTHIHVYLYFLYVCIFLCSEDKIEEDDYYHHRHSPQQQPFTSSSRLTGYYAMMIEVAVALPSFSSS